MMGLLVATALAAPPATPDPLRDLVWAVEDGRRSAVARALDAGVEPNALYHRHSNERKGLLGSLLSGFKKGQPTLTTPTQTAVDRALERGHLALLDLLLERGGSPNLGTAHRQPPLYRAFQAAAQGEGHGASVARLLLEHGADPTLRVDSAPILVLLTATRSDPPDRVVKGLLNAVLEHADPSALLCIAVRDGDAWFTDKVLVAGADPAQCDEDDLSPMHRAAAAGSVPVMERLLAAGVDASVSAVRHGIWAEPIHLAAAAGNADAVARLLEAGAEVDAVARGGTRAVVSPTPLLLAVQAHARGSSRTVSLLVAAGADRAVAGPDGTAFDVAPDHKVDELLQGRALEHAEEGALLAAWSARPGFYADALPTSVAGWPLDRAQDAIARVAGPLWSTIWQSTDPDNLGETLAARIPSPPALPHDGCSARRAAPLRTLRADLGAPSSRTQAGNQLTVRWGETEAALWRHAWYERWKLAAVSRPPNPCSPDALFARGRSRGELRLSFGPPTVSDRDSDRWALESHTVVVTYDDAQRAQSTALEFLRR
jgi:hypothetical protein